MWNIAKYAVILWAFGMNYAHDRDVVKTMTLQKSLRFTLQSKSLRSAHTVFDGQCKRCTPGPNQRSHGFNGAESAWLGLSYSTHVNKAFRPLCSRLGMTSVFSVRLWFITFIVLWILKLKWKRTLRVWSLSHVKHISLKRFLCVEITSWIDESQGY